MLAQLNVYKNLAIGGVVLLLALSAYFYVHDLQEQILTLNSSLKDSYIEVANEKLQSSRYKSSLDSQNKGIELSKVSQAEARDKLRKWRAKPPEVRYITITKIREVKSDECEDIRKVINSVKLIDFNSL